MGFFNAGCLVSIRENLNLNLFLRILIYENQMSTNISWLSSTVNDLRVFSVTLTFFPLNNVYLECKEHLGYIYIEMFYIH